MIQDRVHVCFDVVSLSSLMPCQVKEVSFCWKQQKMWPKNKTRNMFLLHYKVYCDYTYGYCVNQYPLYTEKPWWLGFHYVICLPWWPAHCFQQEWEQADWWVMATAAVITPTNNVFFLIPSPTPNFTPSKLWWWHSKPCEQWEQGSNEGSVTPVHQSSSVFSAGLLCAACCCFFL